LAVFFVDKFAQISKAHITHTRKIAVTLFTFFIVAPNIAAPYPFTNAKKLITVIIPKLKKPAILLVRVILFDIFISIKNGNDVSSTTTNIIAIGRLKDDGTPAEVRTAGNFSNVNN
jgi:hypothetical protein